MARSKAKSRSDYQLPTPYGFRDMARTRFYRSKPLQKGQIKVTPGRCTPTPLTNVPTKYQLPTAYAFRDIARTRFSNSSSLRQGQIKVTPGHCTPTPPNQCPYQASTSYTLRFPRYRPDKLLPAHPPIQTPWVKTIPQQPLRTVG